MSNKNYGWLAVMPRVSCKALVTENQEEGTLPSARTRLHQNAGSQHWADKVQSALEARIRYGRNLEEAMTNGEPIKSPSVYILRHRGTIDGQDGKDGASKAKQSYCLPLWGCPGRLPFRPQRPSEGPGPLEMSPKRQGQSYHMYIRW